MRPKMIYENLELAFPIRVYQTGKDRFRVHYGAQIDKGDYETVTRKLGEAIMHALRCDGWITE